MAEIGGTLWLDRRTAELRRLEFHFQEPNVPQSAAATGFVEFSRMRAGRWAITGWELSMPVLERVPHAELYGAPPVRRTSVHVVGGALVLATLADSTQYGAVDTLWSAPPFGTVPASAARLRMRILDAEGRPIRGADVYIGNDHERVDTDSAGGFETAVNTGATQLMVRRLGFSPLDTLLDLSDVDTLTIQLQRVVALDSVIVSETAVDLRSATSPCISTG